MSRLLVLTLYLSFIHDGLNTTRYELRVDQNPPMIVAPSTYNGELRIPLPILSGTYNLTLSACNETECASATIQVEDTAPHV